MEGCVVHLQNVRFGGDITLQPIIVNFRELFLSRDAPAILPTVLKIKNEDVLRAVVALLDTYLLDLSSEDIHETVHWPGIHTLILSRVHADVLEEYKGKRSRAKERSLNPVPYKITERVDFTHSLLAKVYSDSEDETLDESSEENIAGWSWEQFNEGLHEFVEEVMKRRERRKLEREDNEIPPSAIGVESLIVAAACYEFKPLFLYHFWSGERKQEDVSQKKHEYDTELNQSAFGFAPHRSTGDMVLQVPLLAVRQRFWGLGIGGYIMELLKSQCVVGQYDVLIVHANKDSVGFFKRHGFTDDPLLNNKFKELQDDWINSILMNYLPPFTTDLEMRNPGYSPNLQQLEIELHMLRSQALSSYQQQMMSLTKLIREVKTLHEQLDIQREKVECLNSKLEQEKQMRREIEQRFLSYRLKNAEQILDNIVWESDQEQDQEHADSEHSSPNRQLDEPSIQSPEGAGCS